MKVDVLKKLLGDDPNKNVMIWLLSDEGVWYLAHIDTVESTDRTVTILPIQQ